MELSFLVKDLIRGVNTYFDLNINYYSTVTTLIMYDNMADLNFQRTFKNIRSFQEKLLAKLRLTINTLNYC